MKRIFQIQMILLLLSNCTSKKVLEIDQNPEIMNVEIVKIYENSRNYIFLTKDNDIIESTKLNTLNLKCKKIIPGQRFTFEVIPVSGMIQGNNHFDRTYDINDTLTLSYREYYFAKTIRKYCYKK